MARPKVFVSSTFYDLKHIRASLEVFIESLGFDAILFEKGDIAWHPDRALDESCYHEAASADIFVLIIGGRYGSAASSEPKESDRKTLQSYQSVTKKEYDTAQENNVPTFILIESAVASEYRTYIKNKENTDIEYAHVDSVSVFKLIESIFDKTKNNPIFNFEKATHIESWLREQWAGLFRELLRVRSQQQQLSNLNSQVSELKSVNETLKKYLEEVLQSVKSEDSERIIKNENEKLQKSKSLINLEHNDLFCFLIKSGLPKKEAINFFIYPSNYNDLKILMLDMEEKIVSIMERKYAQADYNKGREDMELETIDFP